MGALFSKPQAEPVEEVVEEEPVPVTPVCILYSYIGTGFHGLQYSRRDVCVENYLFDAMIRARLIPSDAFNQLSRMKWSEASRTDSGVHSAAQVLSCVIAIPYGYKLRDVPGLINQQVNKECTLHVWAAISAAPNFRAQKFADARRYKYLMPLHAFAHQTVEHLNELRANVLPVFVGTKLYHNYTKRVPAESASAWRTIMEFSVSDPVDIEGEQYVIWTIYGKAFMMNQIRKMLACVLACSHGLLTVQQLHETFTSERWALSKAPGDGLLLDKVEYEAVRKKMGRNQNDPNKDVEFTGYRSYIESWKTNVLFPHIAALVKKDDIFRTWLRTVLTPYPPVPQSDPRAEHHHRRKHSI